MDSCQVRESLSQKQSAPLELVKPSAQSLAERRNPPHPAAPPCFFARVCQQRAALEKAGRSVCRRCAETRLRGSEYPLRNSASEPIYMTGRSASEALDMEEEMSQRARRRLRAGIWS